jgi:hypothetical protein
MKLKNIFIGWEIGFSYIYNNKSYSNETHLFINRKTKYFNIGDRIKVLVNPNDVLNVIIKDFYIK